MEGFGFFELFSGALAMLYGVVPVLGLAIILLTVIVRLLLLPLSIKQTRSMREMQVIQPEVTKIRNKYKVDRRKMAAEQVQRNRQKMNEEVMALYREHGVNPLGGCLPLVMQFPVLIALFYVIRAPLSYLGWTVPEGAAEDAVVPLQDYVTQNVTGVMEALQNSALAIDLHERALATLSFLGIRLDCSPSAALGGDDPLQLGAVCGTGILSALPYLLLMLLMGGTTYYQQRQMMASRGAAADQMAQQQQMMMRLMPVMLMVFAYTFPAGVVIYWITTNVWTIVQQRMMLGAVGQSLGLQPQLGDGKPGGKKGETPETAKASKKSAKPDTAKAPKKGAETAGSDGPARRSQPSRSAKKKKR